MKKLKTTGSLIPVPRVVLLCFCTLGVVAGCGNKGPLYIEPDSDTLKELEQVEQEINRATGVPGATTDPDDPDNKNKKNNNGQ